MAKRVGKTGKRRLIAAGALVPSILLVAWGVQLWRGLQACATFSHMMNLYRIIESEQPAQVDPASIDELLTAIGMPDRRVEDAWGQRIRIEIVPPDDGSSRRGYQLRSLGRDGVEGPCCQRHLGDDWNADAVLRNGEWLQAW